MQVKFIFKNLKNEKNAIFSFQKIKFLNYTFHTRIMHGFERTPRAQKKSRKNEQKCIPLFLLKIEIEIFGILI